MADDKKTEQQSAPVNEPTAQRSAPDAKLPNVASNPQLIRRDITDLVINGEYWGKDDLRT